MIKRYPTDHETGSYRDGVGETTAHTMMQGYTAQPLKNISSGEGMRQTREKKKGANARKSRGTERPLALK